MANSKLTKKDLFAIVKGIVENSYYTDKETVYNFIDHEVELISNKSSASKETKTQKENVGIKATILEVLANFDRPVTIKEMLATVELGTYSNQKLSALLTQLIAEEKVRKTYFKKTPMFELV